MPQSLLIPYISYSVDDFYQLKPTQQIQWVSARRKKYF